MPPLKVEWTENALGCLCRFQAFLDEECGSPELAGEMILTLSAAADKLAVNPHIGRPAGPEHPWCHELEVNFGKSGYLMLYEVFRADTIVILSVKHQLEVGYQDQW